MDAVDRPPGLRGRLVHTMIHDDRGYRSGRLFVQTHMARLPLFRLVFAAANTLAAQSAPPVEIVVWKPEGAQHWDCGVRGSLEIQNRSDGDVEVRVDFELSPGWLILSFGAPEFREPFEAPFETTARAGAVSEYWFRLAAPGPRRDARVEMRLDVQLDGRPADGPPPSVFEVTTLGEVLCH